MTASPPASATAPANTPDPTDSTNGTPQVVALDVGGTGMKAALVTAAGVATHTDRRATGREHGPDAVIAGILAFAADLCETAAVRSGSPALAVGLALPGVVNETTGTAVFSANIGWRDVPLRQLMSDRLGLPVSLSHDVRAGGVAEARLGAARGCGHVLVLPIGTGIAGAMVLDGRPYPGGHGAGGEIGHIVVRPGGPPCGCGNYGCLETLASAASISRRYAEATGADVGTEEVIRRATAASVGADPAAVAVWTDAVDALADGLAIYASLLDPELVVIGGGLGAAGEVLLAPLRAALAQRLTFQTAPRLVTAELGDEAGCLGAGLLAWDHLAHREATA